MAFAQLTYRESLRDIQTCLRAAQGNNMKNDLGTFIQTSILTMIPGTPDQVLP
jgi:hypothetical protein